MKWYELVRKIMLTAMVLFLLLAGSLRAQHSVLDNWVVGLDLGVLTGFTDVKRFDFVPASEEIRGGFGVSLSYEISPALNLGPRLLIGRLAGDNRRESFETTISEIGLLARLSINHLVIPGAPINDRFQFYGYGGLNILPFSAELSMNGQAANKVRATAIAFSYGIGIRYLLDERFGLVLETGFRYTGMDKLDGFDRPGSDNDTYNFSSLGIVYRLGSGANMRSMR